MGSGTPAPAAALGQVNSDGPIRWHSEATIHPRFASNSLIYSTNRFTPSIGMAL